MQKTVSIAGWLFADLLLGLAMLFITSMIGVQLPITSVPTPTATFTATSTLTPTPTRTRTPTPLPPGATITPSPTPIPPGLNRVPYKVSIRLDPNLVPGLLSGTENAKNVARDQIRSQMNVCLGQLNDGHSRAGLVLSFGGNPDPDKGEKIATEASDVLLSQFSKIFDQQSTVVKNFHDIQKNNPVANGKIDIEVYLMSGEGLRDVTAFLEKPCDPVPTWCQGNGTTQLWIMNWEENDILNFSFNNKAYQIGSAKGENPSYQCLLVNPGSYGWSARYGSGYSDNKAVEVQTGKTEQEMDFCIQDRNIISTCAGSVPTGSIGK